MTSRRPLGSSNSAEHYLPRPYADAMHVVFDGPPELDVASSAKANRIIRAKRYYTTRGQHRTWRFPTVYSNYPGDLRGVNGAQFWVKANAAADTGETSVLWAVFNINARQRLARFARHPCRWPTVEIGPGAPCTNKGGRIMWIDGATGRPGTAPGYGNAFTMLSHDETIIERFRVVFGAFGTHTRGDWANSLQSQILISVQRDGRARSIRELCDRMPRRRATVHAAIRAMIDGGELNHTQKGLTCPHPQSS